jgi:hypothetical protein
MIPPESGPDSESEPESHSGDDSQTELEVVASYLYPLEAFIARTALENAGIDAVVADDHLISMDWLLATALGGVKLLVRAQDLADAREFLTESKEASETDTNYERDACRRCGSLNTEYIRIGGGLTLLSYLLTGAPLFPLLRRVRCQDCGTISKPTKASAHDES